MAVLVGALTISTWYFTHSYPKTAVAGLSESLRHEILVNTSELLDVIFKMNTYSSTALLNLMDKKFFGDDFGIDSIQKVFSFFSSSHAMVLQQVIFRKSVLCWRDNNTRAWFF